MNYPLNETAPAEPTQIAQRLILLRQDLEAMPRGSTGYPHQASVEARRLAAERLLRRDGVPQALAQGMTQGVAFPFAQPYRQRQWLDAAKMEAQA